MTIEYATYDETTHFLVCFGSYQEAVAAASGADEIWLMVDAWPVWQSIPESFDRLVVNTDGQELRTAVIRRHEASPRWGPTPVDGIHHHHDETYGGSAPLLTINLRNETVQLRQRVSAELEQYTLLWPREGDENPA